MESQAELFPFAHPATVLSYIRRLEIIVLKYAPELTTQHCWELLTDLSLTDRAMEVATRSLMPRIHPFTITVETLLLNLRQLDRVVTDAMSEADALQLLTELTSTTAIAQRIGRLVERDRRWQHRQTVPTPSERETMRASEVIAFSHFERIGRRGRRGASWS